MIFTSSCMMFTSAKDPDVRTVVNGSVVVAVVFLWHFIGDLRILYPELRGESCSPCILKTQLMSVNFSNVRNVEVV